MLAYLAGPLDDVDDGTAWYDEIELLAPPGWVLYCPGSAFKSPGSDPAALDQANRAVIEHSAAVLIAYLDGPGRGFGTIREIEYARSLHRGVVVVAQHLPSLLAHDVLVVPTLREVWPTILEEIDRMVQAQRDHPLFRLLGGGDD